MKSHLSLPQVGVSEKKIIRASSFFLFLTSESFELLEESQFSGLGDGGSREMVAREPVLVYEGARGRVVW